MSPQIYDIVLYVWRGNLAGKKLEYKRKRRDRLIVKILALFFPILLFVFKYILPSWAEGAYTNKKREKEQAKIETIHFPVDLLFVAIGYTIPKIIEVTSQLAFMENITEDSVDEYRRLITCVGIYCAESFVILMVVPFFVFATKFAENNYYKKKKRWIAQTVLCYIVSAGIIWISIFGM